MLVLAIDTSSAAVTAAVVDVSPDEVAVRAQRVTLNSRGHGEFLAPALAECLAEAGAVPGDLGAIVAGTGPGPFTGLRVGLVTASVMADVLGVATYGVCSLDAIAGSHVGPLFVATDARRKEIYWARYLDGVRIEGPDVSRPADVVAGSGAMAGAGARLYADVLGRSLIDRDFPSAAALVQRAADRIRAGAPTELLTPLYLRRPDAVEPGPPKVVTLPRPLRPSRRADPRPPRRGDSHSAPAVVIVAMSAEHIDALMPYERSMFASEAWTASGYRAELADTERRHYLVAQGEQGELLGWAGLMVIADSAEILTVGVIPPARRLGIARLLLDELLAEARQRGAVEAFLEVRVDNEAAQSLYQRDGFVQVGLRPGYYDGGLVDAVVMRREL